jgi:hypothetical protein
MIYRINNAARTANARRVDIHSYEDPEANAKQDSLTTEAQALRDTVRGLLFAGDITERSQIAAEEGQAYRIFNDARDAGVEVGGYQSAQDLLEKAATPEDINTLMQKNAVRKEQQDQPVAMASGASVMMLLAAQFRQDNAPNADISGGEDESGYMPSSGAPKIAGTSSSVSSQSQNVEMEEGEAPKIAYLNPAILRPRVMEDTDEAMPDGMDAVLKGIKKLSPVMHYRIAMRA